MTPYELMSLTLGGEDSVFLLRRRGREVARALTMEPQDQIRLATALSDLGRILLADGAPLAVAFQLIPQPVSLSVALRTPLRDLPMNDPGWQTARRLLDEVDIEHRDPHLVVRLRKALPPSVQAPTPAALAVIRESLGLLEPGNAVDELRAQNEELLTTLAALERKQQELLRLNAELEETNRGVVALYNELTEELAQTNQGVVALYAELDQQSTALKKASDAKTRYWSNVSHEVRTPVNSIVGLARLLLGPGADDLTDEQRRQISLIDAAGSSLLTLVNELLDVAKAESGRLEPRIAEVAPRMILAQLRDVFLPVTRGSGIPLVIGELPEGPVLMTDETLLVRILRNLVSNGLKFTERGEVRLTARVEGTGDGQHWRFEVADSGIGIPPDHLDKVFEEFHQVPNHLQAKAVGTGLGLPYARTLAGVLGGSLELSSTLGAGTTAVLRLPIGDREPELRPASALVATHDDTLRVRLTSVLSPMMDTVRATTDGESAVAAALADPPGLVVIDLSVDGAEQCLAALRQEPRLGSIPVIALSTADTLPSGSSGGSAVVLLHKSQLSRESVRDSIRRAVAAEKRRPEP